MNREEALAYALKMRVRGDNYSQIQKFISSRVGEEMSMAIISEIAKKEEAKEFKVKPPKKELDTGKLLGVLFGSVFLIGGVVLLFVTLDNNIIASMPYVLMGIGAIALFGGIK